MNVCVLYSGGKDSNLALLKASEDFHVSCLVTLKPVSVESEVFHYPNVEVVRVQSLSLGIPLVISKCPDDEEGSLKALRDALIKASKVYGVEGVVTGAIRSTYQATRFQRVCDRLGLWCFNPLWLRDEISLLKEVIDLGFEVIITRVAGIGSDFLGRKIDLETVEMLRREMVNPSGEGGEYETLVLYMPLFRDKIRVEDFEVVGRGMDATLVIKRVRCCSRSFDLQV